MARGILWLVMLYLLYIFGRYSKIDVSLDTLLLAPNLNPKKAENKQAESQTPITRYSKRTSM